MRCFAPGMAQSWGLMAIKDNNVRKRLWEMRFQQPASPAACVEAFAAMASKSQVYDTLAQFSQNVSWEYTSRRTRVDLCAGGLTKQQLAQLKLVIDQDSDRMYCVLRDEMVSLFNVHISIESISVAVTTSVAKGGLGYSHKVKQHAAGEKDHVSRSNWRAYIDILLPPHSHEWDKVIFFDEMHRSLREGRTKTALGPRGTAPTDFERFSLEARETFTLIAALTTRGVAAHTA